MTIKLAILYTGGTIGCVGTPLAPLNTEAFKQAFLKLIVPVVQTRYPTCEFEFIRFYSGANDKTLDSTNLQPNDWCQMASSILTYYADYDGFIILHGTDTMAWSASALSFLLTGLNSQGQVNAALSKPVVFTGSQLPLFHQNLKNEFTLRFNTDALQNICGAVNAVYSGINEVALYFNDSLLRGNRCIKTNANSFNAFSSPNYPLLAKQGIEFSLATAYLHPKENDFTFSLDNPLVHSALKKQLAYISQHINNTRVIPFSAFPASYADNDNLLASMLEACIEQGIDGLILESYGNGNFPAGNITTPEKGAVYQCLKKARQQGIVIVDCTQVLAGNVNFKTYAAGSWLADKDIAAIEALDMSAIASFCKLIYLLTLKDYHHWDIEKIATLMLKNICGEINT